MIPLLFHSQDTTGLANCNVEFKLRDCSVIKCPFFNIDVILPFKQDGDSYSQIFSSGQVFYSTLTMEYLLDLVDEEINEIHVFKN